MRREALRGHLRAGMSAGQWAAPSTFWAEDVLARMQAEDAADLTLDAVVGPDPGRDWRRLSCLDSRGRTAAYSGAWNGHERGHLLRDDQVAAGNT